ncbi:MAG TPA: hypothetical protein VJQ45_07655 [Ktedonobacterales bacterium]|nr:hypothetical protein [Ktedonobacterales bacterium]
MASKVSSRPQTAPLWLLAVAVIAFIAMVVLMVPNVLPAVSYPIQSLGLTAIAIMILLFIWLSCLLMLFLSALRSQEG